MNERKGKQKAKKLYDQEAGGYIKQYQENYEEYPANLIRIQFVIERLKKNNVKTILDVGCGTCGPMIKLLTNGFVVKGFDFSKKMIEQGREELQKAGYDPELIQVGDLEDKSAFSNEKFDAIIALGVFPHIVDEQRALSHMRKLLNPGGLVFIEFRNELFAVYTFNKYSLEFFTQKLINVHSLPRDISTDVMNFYSKKFKAGTIAKKKDGKIAYADTLAKFRNPLSIGNELFNPCGFSIANLHFYHYHALPPVFENRYPKIFRELSLKLEKTNDWKGYLMASAFVVEARRTD
ncbi:MAG: class I SAM-dependent methyltransferase [Minisyncoccia bacterium]|jgi:2-polyprenyl-3-methyl-5-hydroxy-6-metoxy-1,4-benzoquinol methylase